MPLLAEVLVFYVIVDSRVIIPVRIPRSRVPRSRIPGVITPGYKHAAPNGAIGPSLIHESPGYHPRLQTRRS